MGKKIAILYGSESGNAEEFAHSLSHKLHRYHFPHHVSSFMDYEPKDILSCKYLFIITSTRGQGDFPKNVANSDLWTFLKRADLPDTFLNHLNIAFLGLGDSSYSHFQYAVRKLQKRMVEQLGAKELFPRYETDELGVKGSGGESVEAVYFAFEKQLISLLTEKFKTRKVDGKSVKRVSLDDTAYLAPSIVLEETNISQTSKQDAVHDVQIDLYTKAPIKEGRILLNKRITAEDHFQDVRQLHIQCDDNYEPGDTLAIYAQNTDEDVESFLQAQPHWLPIADKKLAFKTGSKPEKFLFDHQLTLRNLLKYHFDIMSIPRRTFFTKVWTFSTDSTRLSDGEEQLTQQREKLKEFGFDQDLQDLYDYCNRPRRSVLEVIQDFESLKLPWEYVFDYLPPIVPRYYSISSSYNGKYAELTVAIVKYRTILHKVREGLSTKYIASLKEGQDTVKYSIQHNSLLSRLPNREHPVIMISPGTGLAPVKSLISSQIFSNQQYVFFGCRYKDKDYLYREELEQWDSNNKLKLFTCFSRDISSSPNVKYVQDLLWENGAMVCKLIKDANAYIYLCGSSGKMPVQVKLTLLEILKKYGNFENDERAEEYFQSLQKQYRYLQETW
ncbi:hypothetical protein ACO0QE_003312 [Hanseniaspora vineae]